MPNYGDCKYWEERYEKQKGSTFDWLENYETLKPIMDELNFDKKSIKSLMVGCGNAEMSYDMYIDGYTSLTNIDISEVVIEQMKDKYNETTMKWDVMDVRDIKYPDNEFDLIVDKSTIDAILCGESSFVNVAIMLNEIQRVLKVHGYYMIISYGQPENRIFHLEREHLGFDISLYSIKKGYSIKEDDDIEKVSL